MGGALEGFGREMMSTRVTLKGECLERERVVRRYSPFGHYKRKSGHRFIAFSAAGNSTSTGVEMSILPA
jgi:hypothetical protein